MSNEILVPESVDDETVNELIIAIYKSAKKNTRLKWIRNVSDLTKIAPGCVKGYKAFD